MLTILAILLLSIGLGYALLSQDLTINGTTKVKGNSWDIHFNNVQINSNSVTLSNDDSAAAINQTDNTLVEYTVTLNKPGDFYEFTVDVVNAGTVDGMVSVVTSKLNNTVISTTNPLPAYLDYSVTYSSGMPIAPNQLLEANSTDTYKVRVEFKKDIDNSELPATDQSNSFSFGVTYVQADDSAQTVLHPASFATDSWETIIGAVKVGATSAYHVGDTKEIELGNSLGTNSLRIVNKSTPSECSGQNFSQTACGFVLEFVDAINGHAMAQNTNEGGWAASQMRAYLNDLDDSTSVINSLPEVLRNGILDTTVVSGHGPSAGETNFTTVDKLYLQSTHEIWEDVDGDSTIGIDFNDSAYHNTRQLDYYAELGVTIRNYSGVAKRKNGSTSYWWLRSVLVNNEYHNFRVSYDGSVASTSVAYPENIAPAFRIG